MCRASHHPLGPHRCDPSPTRTRRRIEKSVAAQREAKRQKLAAEVDRDTANLVALRKAAKQQVSTELADLEDQLTGRKTKTTPVSAQVSANLTTATFDAPGSGSVLVATRPPSTRVGRKQLVDVLYDVREKVATNDRFGFDEPWDNFANYMRLVSSQMYGPRLQNRIAEHFGWEVVPSSGDRGDVIDENGNHQEIKVTLQTPINDRANFVQIRPHQNLTGYHLFVLETDNTLTHLYLTKQQMNKELKKHGELAHGTRGSAETHKNPEYAMHLDWAADSEVREQWVRDYGRPIQINPIRGTGKPKTQHNPKLQEAVDRVYDVRSFASRDRALGFNKPWREFSATMRLLSPQMYGPRIQNRIAQHFGWTPISSSKNRGDVVDSQGRHREVKVSIQTPINTQANFVQIRPHQALHGYDLFVVEKDNTLTHLFLTRKQMAEELRTYGQLAHGTRQSARTHKNPEYAIHLDWREGSEVREAWLTKYRQPSID